MHLGSAKDNFIGEALSSPLPVYDPFTGRGRGWGALPGCNRHCEAPGPLASGRSPWKPVAPRAVRACPRVQVRSVGRGAHRPAIEPREVLVPDADAVDTAEGKTGERAVSRAPSGPAWS